MGAQGHGILSKDDFLGCGLPQAVSNKSAHYDFSFFLSVGLLKYRYPAIRFGPSNLFLSHNNENVRGGVIKPS